MRVDYLMSQFDIQVKIEFLLAKSHYVDRRGHTNLIT